MTDPVVSPRRIQPLTVWAILLVLGLGLVVGVLVVKRSLAHADPNQGRPRFLGRIEKTPELIERSGRRLTLGEMQGKVWLACYVYTTCPRQCMGVLEEVKDIAREIGSDPRLRCVAFSLQPETDTPAQLTQWAKDHEVDTPQWMFLTTDKPEEMSELMTGPKSQFKLNPVVKYDPATQADLIVKDGPFIHDARIVLVDPDGHIRGYYNLIDPEIGDLMRANLLRDLKAVLAESSGGGRSLWWLAALAVAVVLFVAFTGGRRSEPAAPAA